MLEIHENSDNIAYKKQLEAIDVDFPVIVEAFENGSVTGYGIYSLTPETVTVHDFSDTDNLYLLDGIIRTMLFKAAMKGIDRAEFALSDEHKNELLKRLGYGKSVDSLNEFFSGCKNCK